MAVGKHSIVRRRSKDAALGLLAENPPIGMAFLDVATQALQLALGCRWAGVALLNGDGHGVRVVAGYDDDRRLPELSFELAGTPCGELHRGIPGNGYVYFSDAIPSAFPHFQLFGMDAVSTYLGAAFKDEAGKVLGHTFLAHDETFDHTEDARAFVGLVAQRVGMEWVRWQSEIRFRALFDACRDGIVVTQSEGKLLDANPAALSLLNWEKEIVIGQVLRDLLPGVQNLNAAVSVG